MNPATSTPATKPARAINLQTPGPIDEATTGPVMKGYQQPFGIAQRGTANLVAGVFGDVRGGETVAEVNAHLLAASYTVFDKAGRALGIDAAELAEKIDLERLISVASNALQCLDRWPEADLPSGSVREACVLETRAHLRNMLAKLPLRAS